MTSEDRDSTSVAEPDETGARSSHSPAPASKPAKKKHLPVWQETILLLGIAVVLAIVIKALFVQAFYIPSQSMEPGLVKNDRILVQKVSYWFGGGPERGDVVVFKDPGGWLTAEESAGPTNGVAKLLSKVGLYPSGGHLVKRVIGVAGDTVSCCDVRGRIEVNGQPLDEKDYARLDGAECYGPMVDGCDKDWEIGPIPAGHIFVMGDNRNNSADSSFHMCKPSETDCTKNPYVDVGDVVGKVFVLLWPSDHFKFLHRPDTFAGVPDPS
ncbi:MULTISPECIES: signal peptidase I [unclassified Nocardioides]|uniref:signal peptidase I n=1 Tax=unclassified Nocardioides TaxID=2615069 RepID=UPI000056FDA6|nr:MULTISPECIES: signal peptidase I [unclassified Nocardioides]ABL82756.1 signal peptidase I, Serine peptidase, MEROPS family S26A [Nocardioides sp. JS614]